MAREEDMRRDPNWNHYADRPAKLKTEDDHPPDFPEYVEPYESDQPCGHLPRHLERIAQRDYVGVNEGYWVLRDAAALIRALLTEDRARQLTVSDKAPSDD